MKPARWLWMLALLLTAVGGWYARGLLDRTDGDSEAEAEPSIDPAEMAVAVEVHRVVTGNLPVTVVADGTVALPPEAAATITTRAHGRVVEVVASPGQRVRAGDLLLRFERAPLEAALLHARSELERARSELAEFENGGRERMLVELKAAVERGHADHDLAEAQQKRLEALHEQGLVSDKAVAEARALAAQARRDLGQSEQALAVFTTTGADLKHSTLQA